MAKVDLPDFDDMLEMAEKIGNLSQLQVMLENKLEEKLASITDITSSDEEFFVNDKPPSMIYTETNYHKLGIDRDGLRYEDLQKIKNKLAETKGRLRTYKNQFQVMSKMIDVWKADQYNKNQAEY